MKEADILDDLLSMDLASLYVNPADLQGMIHNLYSRPTIAFKLECESSYDRK